MSQVDLTKITTPFGLLDSETQEALRNWEHGWQAYTNSGSWINWKPSWGNSTVYRARTTPLMPDTIDWSHVAPEWKWMARDGNGKTYLFTNNPVTLHDTWVADEGEYARIEGVLSSYRRGTVSWRDSLVQRPEGV